MSTSFGWEGKTGMVHAVSGCARGVQVKLWDPLRTRAIPERLRGVLRTSRYTNSRLPYLTLPYIDSIVCYFPLRTAKDVVLDRHEPWSIQMWQSFRRTRPLCEQCKCQAVVFPVYSWTTITSLCRVVRWGAAATTAANTCAPATTPPPAILRR